MSTLTYPPLLCCLTLYNLPTYLNGYNNLLCALIYFYVLSVPLRLCGKGLLERLRIFLSESLLVSVN
ncbi:MAG: hypothetical protein AB1422_16675 [bacterium]